jgi:AcrR family transcriptional regulator
MSGLRERQKAGRRSDILNAASLLFRRGGFAETRIEQIADRARLSPATVYNYFASKGDLLLALVALDGEEVRAAGAALIADPPADPVTAVNRLLEGYVDHSLVHLDKRLWRQMMGTALSHAETPIGSGYRALDRKLAQQVTALCRALRKRGDIPMSVECEDAGQVLFYVCNSLFMEFVADDATSLTSMKRRMSRQIRLVFAGLIGDAHAPEQGGNRATRKARSVAAGSGGAPSP